MPLILFYFLLAFCTGEMAFKHEFKNSLDRFLFYQIMIVFTFRSVPFITAETTEIPIALWISTMEIAFKFSYLNVALSAN